MAHLVAYLIAFQAPEQNISVHVGFEVKFYPNFSTVYFMILLCGFHSLMACFYTWKV